MNNIQVGLIGAGWWGIEAHLPAIKSHPNATVSAVQTRNEEKRAWLVKEFEVEKGYDSADELLRHPGLDAVIISSTPNVHFAQAKAAMERGLHVLIEKPMTITAAESAELLSMAEARNLQFLISCPWHYTRHARLARECIERGSLGRIEMINIFMTNFTLGLYQGRPFSEAVGAGDGVDALQRPVVEPNRASYCDPAVAGGGHIYCQCSHVLAYLGFLTGLKPREISARFQSAGTAVDVMNAMHIRFAEGALATIASGGIDAALPRDFEIRVLGTEGILYLELWKGRMELRRLDGSIETPDPLDATEIYPKFAPTTNFINAILGRETNESPATLGHYAMRLIEAACQSATREEPISLA